MDKDKSVSTAHDAIIKLKFRCRSHCSSLLFFFLFAYFYRSISIIKCVREFFFSVASILLTVPFVLFKFINVLCFSACMVNNKLGESCAIDEKKSRNTIVSSWMPIEKKREYRFVHYHTPHAHTSHIGQSTFSTNLSSRKDRKLPNFQFGFIRDHF